MCLSRGVFAATQVQTPAGIMLYVGAIGTRDNGGGSLDSLRHRVFDGDGAANRVASGLGDNQLPYGVPGAPFVSVGALF